MLLCRRPIAMGSDYVDEYELGESEEGEANRETNKGTIKTFYEYHRNRINQF